jgi:hypothetical protein
MVYHLLGRLQIMHGFSHQVGIRLYHTWQLASLVLCPDLKYRILSFSRHLMIDDTGLAVLKCRHKSKAIENRTQESDAENGVRRDPFRQPSPVQKF